MAEVYKCMKLYSVYVYNILFSGQDIIHAKPLQNLLIEVWSCFAWDS